MIKISFWKRLRGQFITNVFFDSVSKKQVKMYMTPDGVLYMAHSWLGGLFFYVYDPDQVI